MGFRDDLEQDPISSLPIRDAVVIQPDTTLREAVELMRARALGCAIVVDPSGTPSGMFTEKCLLHALRRDASLDDRTVSDHLEPEFRVVASSEPIARVWDAIERDGLRFICVTDEDGKLVGVTGQRGIAEYLAESFPRQVVVQRLGSTPWMQQREGA